MKLLFVGDTVLNKPLNLSDRIKEIFSQYNYRIANLEGCFSRSKNGILKAGPHVIMNEEYLEDFSKIFNVVVLANNHTMDCGEEGYDYTLELLNKNNIQYCGIGNNIEEALKSTIIDNIAIISVAEHEFGGADINKIGIATCDRELYLFKEIKKQKELKRKVYLYYHGGSEIIPLPPPYLRERFNLYKEFGVDFIIGSHPHVVQGYESPFFYSLGNFWFPNVNFSMYKNSDWSLAVGIDTETNHVQITALSNNEIIDLCEEKYLELEQLCSLLYNNEYYKISNHISYHLYRHWYPELQGQGSHASYILHHLRCDAHRYAVCTGLSINMNEKTLDSMNFNIINPNGDAIEINAK